MWVSVRSVGARGSSIWKPDFVPVLHYPIPVPDESGGAFLLYTLSGAPREAFEDFGLPRATTGEQESPWEGTRLFVALDPAVDLVLTADVQRHWSTVDRFRITNVVIGPALSARFGF